MPKGGNVSGAEPEAEGDAYRYWAFLSYAHSDAKAAAKLHDDLETFKVPKALVGSPHPLGAVPEKLAPIFRDRQELAASADLGGTIRQALQSSRYLIVLCSPAAVDSKWVDQEIREFEKIHGEDRVLAAIIDGEPFASGKPGQERLECFPESLRFHVDQAGEQTSEPAEPIAADLRDEGDGWRTGVLKVAAGMLGVGLDTLIQREQVRRQRRLKMIATGSIAGMVLTSGLAAFAIDSRDTARDQRKEAESLVAFMLGDLREELEPIGRLDALDKVGERALAYFESQDKSDLSDDQLAQRSKALAMMGEIALQRGDLDGASARYAESMRGTAELIDRNPDSAQLLFDHAQSVFWVGEVSIRRGKLDEAERAFIQYEQLADRMVTLEPDKREWQMEVNYATANLGIANFHQGKFADAERRFQRALAAIERLSAADPENQEYQKNFLENLAWIADAQEGQMKLAEAIATRERQVAQIEDLSARYRDVEFRDKATPARRALGRMLASNGATNAGVAQLQRAVEIGASLMRTEPDNLQWAQSTADAHLDLGRTYLAVGQLMPAATHVRSACDIANRLIARNRDDVKWRGLYAKCLLERGRLALRQGASLEAVSAGEQALAQSRKLTGAPNNTGLILEAQAHKLIGDAMARSGDRASAKKAWNSALKTWPKEGATVLRERAIYADLLAVAGRDEEARKARQELRRNGYRRLI